MTRHLWVAAFADAAERSPPVPGELDEMIELGGVAAHLSERFAAPIMRWLPAAVGLPPGARELAPSWSVGV